MSKPTDFEKIITNAEKIGKDLTMTPTVVCPLPTLLKAVSELVRECIGKSSDIRTAKPADEYEQGFDYGYDEARAEICQRFKEALK